MESRYWQGPITIVGAGLAGAACARELSRHGVEVRVLDRAKAPGGRLGSPELHGRRVDLGAAYFTVRDSEFSTVAAQWQDAEIARPWTDTLEVLSPGRPPESTTGPMRWAAPAGLRSLARAVLDGLDVSLQQPVTELPGGAVVLAMPDPQAARLVTVPDPVDYAPVIALVLESPERTWPFSNGAFIHDVPELSFVADDGARRGDHAPVLVVHSSATLAAQHLDEPAGAIGPMLAATRTLFDLPEPIWTHAHRWTFAQPAGQHRSSFGFAIQSDGREVGLIGDQWCPAGSPRVESAWRSGVELARAIVTARA